MPFPRKGRGSHSPYQRRYAGLVPRGQSYTDVVHLETGNDKLEFIELDLASLDSVRQFVTEFTKRGLPLNYLINNAGVVREATCA